MTAANLGLAFLAGVLSILSPCVLPLVPIVLGSAASEHRLGPAALAAGLALSFAAIGIFIASIGFAIGLNSDVFRPIAAALLMAVGAILVFSSLPQRMTLIAAPLSDWMNRRFASQTTSGLSGQFGVGLLLGAIWSPCVGPTLGQQVSWRRREKIWLMPASRCWVLAWAQPFLSCCSACFRASSFLPGEAR